MKTILLKSIFKPLIMLVVALLFSTANAQNISNIVVPPTGTSCTSTSIQVDVVQNCINYIYNGTNQTVVGNTLFLNLDWATPSPICFGALSFIQETFVFPTLPAGVNTVEVRTFLDGVQQDISVGGITVTACCSSLASFTSNFNDKCSAETDTFMFTNTSTGSTSQEWYVNNILTATTVDFAPVLTLPASYSIKLKVTDGTCSDSTTQSVNIFPSPTVDLGPDIQSCVNQFEVLDAGAGFANYAWSPSGASSQSINVTSSGSYNATVTTISGCTASDTVNVTFNPLPVVSLGNDTSVCINNTIMLDAGNFVSYVWNTSDTTQIVEASPSGGIFGVYEVEVTDNNGCQNSDNIVLTGLAQPNLDLGADSVEICQGDSVELDAGAHTSYAWNTGATSQTINANVSQFYLVTVSNADNCTSSDSTFVDILTGPIVDLGNDTTICFGQDVSFDAGSFASYVWSDNSTMQTFAVDSNMYTLGVNTIAVAVTDNDGCLGGGTLSLEVINCDTSVGIQSLSFTQEVLVYPNPIEDYLLIETETTLEVLDITIVDLSGKTLLSTSYEDVNFLKLDTESLENGFYFLVLQSGKQMEVRKISKK